jgi:hypothetical protein
MTAANGTSRQDERDGAFAVFFIPDVIMDNKPAQKGMSNEH